MSSISEQVQSLQQAWLQQWRGMSANERRLLAVAVGLALVTLLVLVGIRPAWRTLQTTPAQMQLVERELAVMRAQAAEADALKQRAAIPALQAEGSLNASTARLGPGASLVRQGDRAVLTFRQLSGEGLAVWLEDVRVGARAKVVEAEWTQGGDGLYRGSVTLSLNAGGGAS